MNLGSSSEAPAASREKQESALCGERMLSSENECEVRGGQVSALERETWPCLGLGGRKGGEGEKSACARVYLPVRVVYSLSLYIY